MSLVVATFYKFVKLPDRVELREKLYAIAQQHDIKGTILLAQEGINATIAGTREAIDYMLSQLRSDSRFADLTHKESTTEIFPFERLKVRLKKEIVTIGNTEVDPTDAVGTYVTPQEWNALITDPDVVVIDTRNEYEVEIGTFKGAKNPKTDSFRQFPDYVQQHLDPSTHRKVAMFCTGGIRCEKASSLMIRQGFQEVYHLEGGILKYLEEIPPEDSLWEGECFVFDQRVAVKHGLEVGSYESCLACGRPISEADKTSHHYQLGISCPHCCDQLSDDKLRRQIARLRQRQTNSHQHP